MSAARVRIEKTVHLRLMKLGILSSTSFQLENNLLGVGSAAVEQSRRKTNIGGEGVMTCHDSLSTNSLGP